MVLAFTSRNWPPSQPRSTIDLEVYIFHQGKISARYLEALTERASTGVDVRLTIDYIGSLSTPLTYFEPLLAAGGQVRWYHPLRIRYIPEFNNGTHREILTIDGAIAFVGGAGIADWWMWDGIRGKRWRDMMVRVQGPSAVALQAVFPQNWLRVSGDPYRRGLFFKRN
jgi:cardiolipin synthase